MGSARGLCPQTPTPSAGPDFSYATSSPSLWNPPKKDAMRPPGARESHKPHPKTNQCVSTSSPLSARHGRLTSRRRIWHASRTKRSVSNIIGSPPNGPRFTGRMPIGRSLPRTSNRFIILDHPPGLKPSSSRAQAPSSGPRAGLESLKPSSRRVKDSSSPL